MADFEVTFVDVGHGDATLIKIPGDRYVLVDIYRCPGEGIDLFKLLDDSLPDGDDGRKRLDVLAITHAHDDHIAGIGDLYDRYQVVDLWLPQHAKKLQQVAGNDAEFERVQEEHPDEQTEWPKGSRSMWKTLGENGEVSVRCFSPPGTTRKQAPRSVADLPKSTPQAEAFAKQLKSQGYRFVGPTSVYAFMQNVGVVNDHVHGCFRATDYPATARSR